MRKRFNFQLFEDGGGGGQGAGGSQGGGAGSGNGSQQNAGTYSFQQAEEIANARAERASKAALKSYFQQQGMNEEEVEQALKDYKTKKAQQTPNVTAVEAERDAARKELEDLKNSNLLRDKGVKTEDLDYVMFKVNQIAAEKKQDFKKVAEEYLKENPRFTGQGTYRISTSASAASSGSAQNSNDDINAAIRRAAGR